jgi:ssDNA-binding replication factor A large subunit
MSIATAEHVSKNHVRVVAADGYEITVFNLKGLDIEVIVVSDNGDEAVRLHVAAAKAGQFTRIDKATDGSVVDIFYLDDNG